MPEFAERFEYERKITSDVGAAFVSARAQAEAGRAPNLDTFATSVRLSLEEQLLAAFVVVYMLASDPSNITAAQLTANSLGASFARQQAATVTQELTRNISRDLQNSVSTDKIFRASRVETLAATEVTRAVTRAESEARRQRSGSPRDGRRTDRQRSPAAERRDTRRPASLDIRDGLVAIWRTEQDARVCPICSPLNGERQEAWINSFPDGPPAHPNCRCHLTYEATQ